MRRDSSPVDLGVGFLADGGDGDGETLRPCRVEEQKRKAAVAGDEA